MTAPNIHDEALEAAREAVDQATVRGVNLTGLATAALSAAAPFIAAQAKAEALREAADEFGSWGPTGIAAANALRNRAATIEGKDS